LITQELASSSFIHIALKASQSKEGPELHNQNDEDRCVQGQPDSEAVRRIGIEI
jgi:hypothetical protein